MVVHQATFGDRENAYALLTSSLPREITKRMANLTDLQEPTPDGVEWDSCLRGFGFDEYYLVLRTYMDKTPGIRKGRVYSHALILNKVDLFKVNNFSSLLDHLPASLEKSETIQSFVYTPSVQQHSISDLRIGALVHELVVSSNKILAWVGYSDFERAICAIWDGVPASLRNQLRFGIGFNPVEAKGFDGVQILAVPSKLSTKWRLADISIIDPAAMYRPTSEVERFITQSSSESIISTLFEDACIQLTSFDQLKYIDRAASTTTQLDIADLNSLITLSETVNVLSFKKTIDSDFSQRIFNRVISILTKASTEEIVRLRNQDPLSFHVSHPESQLSFTMSKRILALLEGEKDFDSILVHYSSQTVLNWWRETVRSSITVFLRKLTSPKATTVLSWIANINQLNLRDLCHMLPKSALETDFLLAVPRKIETEKGERICQFAVIQGWPVLHATYASVIFSAIDALKMQQSIDPGLTSKAATQVLLDRFGPKVCFESLLKMNGVDALLGEMLARYSDLWKLIDVKKAVWQRLWIDFCEQGNDPWKFIENPLAKLYSVMDAIISADEAVHPRLISLLSLSRVNDLLYYKKRSKIWDLLPAIEKRNFLKSTSLSYLRKEFSNPEFKPDEIMLSDCFSENTLTIFLDMERDNLPIVLPVLAQVKSSALLLRFLRTCRSEISMTDGEQLGNLVQMQHCEHCAKQILRLSQSYSSFSYALKSCYKLLGFFDRWSALNLIGETNKVLSEDEWWSTFAEVSSELYPEGPKTSNIWERAGGELHELDLGGSGGAQWRLALKKIRHGASNVGLTTLIATMLDEFRHNTKLNALKKLLHNDW